MITNVELGILQSEPARTLDNGPEPTLVAVGGAPQGRDPLSLAVEACRLFLHVPFTLVFWILDTTLYQVTGPEPCYLVPGGALLEHRNAISPTDLFRSVHQIPPADDTFEHKFAQLAGVQPASQLYQLVQIPVLGLFGAELPHSIHQSSPLRLPSRTRPAVVGQDLLVVSAQ